MRQENTTHRILMRYLKYFLLVLLVPTLALTVIYFCVTDNVTENAYNQNLAAIQTSSITLESSLDDLINLSYYIASNSQMNRFFAMKNIRVDRTIVSDVYETQRDLRAFTISNNMISGIQLYTVDADLLVDSQTSSLSLERYYGNIFEIEDYSLLDWREQILLHPFKAKIFPARSIRYNGTPSRRIMFVQSVPYALKSRLIGNIIIFMDEYELARLFHAIPYHSGGGLYVLDENGTPMIEDISGALSMSSLNLSRLTGECGHDIQVIDGKEMLIIYSKESRYKWQYIAAIPRAEMLASTKYIRTFLVLVIAATLATGVGLSVLSTYKASRPVVSIYQQLLSSGTSLSPNDLSDEIASIMKHNSELKSVIDQQIPAQKVSFLYSLLTGGFQDKAEMLMSFEKLGVALPSGRYVVLVAALPDLDTNQTPQEIGVYKELVKEIMTDAFPATIGACDMDFERIAFLVSLDDASEMMQRAIIEKAIDRLSGDAFGRAGISLYFAAAIIAQLEEVPAAFSAVQAAIYYSRQSHSRNIIWCDHESSADTVYYPDTIESRLLWAAKEGKTVAVQDAIDTIARHNKAVLTSDSLGYELDQRLYATLVRIAKELPSGNDPFLQTCSSIAFELNSHMVTAQEIFHRLGELFVAATIFSSENTLSSGALRAEVLAYVNTHYADPQISLASVADHFRITEVYLSRVFKHITGENFSRHIEKLRMEQANRLMLQGGHRITEIADKVGYNSPQVFRRAYKRCFGILPSEFVHDGKTSK